MSLQRKIKQRAIRRTNRVRGAIHGDHARARVSVFRSLKHMYAQIINDAEHKTVTSCSSLDLKSAVSGAKKDVARQVGLELAKRARALGIDAVVFDRGPYMYHGRVKSFADGLREGGIRI